MEKPFTTFHNGKKVQSSRQGAMTTCLELLVTKVGGLRWRTVSENQDVLGKIGWDKMEFGMIWWDVSSFAHHLLFLNWFWQVLRFKHSICSWKMSREQHISPQFRKKENVCGGEKMKFKSSRGLRGHIPTKTKNMISLDGSLSVNVSRTKYGFFNLRCCTLIEGPAATLHPVFAGILDKNLC